MKKMYEQKTEERLLYKSDLLDVKESDLGSSSKSSKAPMAFNHPDFVTQSHGSEANGNLRSFLP